MAYPNFNQMTDDEFRKWAYNKYSPENFNNVLRRLSNAQLELDQVNGNDYTDKAFDDMLESQRNWLSSNPLQFTGMDDNDFRDWASKKYTEENTKAIYDQLDQEKQRAKEAKELARQQNPSFGDYAKNMNSKLAESNAGVIAGGLLSGLGSYVGNKYDDTQTEAQKSAQSSILGAVGMIPGYGQFIAAGLGGLNALGEMTGMSTSNVNKDSAKQFGLGTQAEIQNFLGYIPGASAIAGGIGSAFFGGGRSKAFKMSDEAASLSDGLSGTINRLQSAEDLSEKRWFGKKAKNAANSAIDTANQQDTLLSQLGRVKTQSDSSDYYQDIQNQRINRYAGNNYLGMRVGKQGMKLMSAEEARRIIHTRKFQNGGVIGQDTNLLPEGAMHRELNHLEDKNPDLEDVTKKGIPVMSVTNGQVGEQVAEVEESEIILRLEVTKKLEELMQNGSDEAMIEAGKLLASEIIENTKDNTGLINGDTNTKN